jgi:transcriptional regulator with XRE-family HTH domain
MMKLREWLYQNRLTISAFALILQIDRSYLHMIISGKKKPSAKIVQKIKDLTSNMVENLDYIKD